MCTLGLVIEEAVNLGDGSVEDNDREAMVSSVQDQVLAHNSEANEAKISTGFGLRKSADIDAGETRSVVSGNLLSMCCAMINLRRINESRWVKGTPGASLIANMLWKLD